jgi:phosphoglucomutase
VEGSHGAHRVEERDAAPEIGGRVSASISPLAGKVLAKSWWADIPKILAAYAGLRPDPAEASQRVAFGTSGHRGGSLDRTFNEWHVLAISQAICEWRAQKSIDGPLYVGFDTHALSRPAFESALEVFAANGVETMVSKDGEFTPTPAVSLAILLHNRGRTSGFADGVVVTPSHNPPGDGGFKYNSPNGGPADVDVTGWIQDRANALIEAGLRGVQRIPFDKAMRSTTTHPYDFLGAYVRELGQAVDFEAIAGSKLRLGVDPLGGAGVHYWARIAERYAFDLTVVSEEVDPTFRFMTADWDGKIRMDPSSRYAMQRLIGLKDRFDVAFACDTDHDRHGIVTREGGLMPPNHYLSVLVDHLYRNRPRWGPVVAIGKTVVTTALIDRVAERLGRDLCEVPVGFKWFVDGLLGGALGFGGEESAGASFLRRDGTVWITDKDGIVAALLAAEITARSERDPAELYRDLTRELGEPAFDRIDAPATAAQKTLLAKLSPRQVPGSHLAGDRIEKVLDHAPANNAPIGGIKVVTASGWFAARPSGTEDIYKIYAESFRSDEHLRAILRQAQGIVDAAIATAPSVIPS